MVDVHKSREEKRGLYSTIFTKQSWLIKDLLHSKKDFSALRMKNDLFISRERKESQPFFFWLNKATGVFCVFSFFFTVCCRLFDSSLKFSKNYENCMSLGNFCFSFFFLGNPQRLKVRPILPARVANQNIGFAPLISLSKLNDRDLEQIDSRT